MKIFYRRTEELIGNMYSQYMASAPPLSLENETPKLNGYLKRTESKRLQNSLTPQDSTETNTSDDITPQMVKDNDKIFTVENQMAKIGSLTREETSLKENSLTRDNQSMNMSKTYTDNIIKSTSLDGVEKQVSNIDIATRNDLPNVLRPRRNILEPIKKEDVPSWSLAKGPCVVAMQRKTNSVDNEGKYILYFY